MTVDDQKLLAYLDGQLPDTEMDAIANLAERDPEVMSRLAEYQDMTKYLRYRPVTEAALQNLHRVHTDVLKVESTLPRTPTTDTNGQMRNRRLVLVLLSLFAVGAIALAILYQPSPSDESSPEILYAAYFDPAEISFATRDRQTDRELLDAAEMFNDGQYNQVITLLEGRVEPKARFALGISLLDQGRTIQARQVFDELRRDQTIYSDDVYWYTGLSHLRDGNTLQAITAFQLIDRSSNKKRAAESILEKLSD
ncbi:MAG: hypothetical protein AAFR14_00435 [Bacteroidota bacterium]